MMKRYSYGLATIVLLIILWYGFALHIDNRYILPSPLITFHTFIGLLSVSLTYKIIFFTLLRLLIAMVIACVSGVLLGLIAGHVKALDYALQPIVTTLRTLPVASIIIIVLILIGNANALFTIAFLMLFPVIYEATKQGVITIHSDIKDALSLDPYRVLEIIPKIYFPLAMPFIKTALLQSIGLGFKVLVMAEFIDDTPTSIGSALYHGSISINYQIVFAWTLIIIIIVSVIEVCVRNIRT